MNDTNDTNLASNDASGPDPSNDESATDTTEANSTVHDLSTERPEDSPTVTVRLSRNQMLTVTNSLGSEAIDARNDDRKATFRSLWDLRDGLKEALEAEL